MEFYFVFEGLEFETKYFDLQTAIRREVFDKISILERRFAALRYSEKGILLRLAKGARKLNKMYDPRFKSALNALKKSGLIKIEKTRQKPYPVIFGQRLSRELRRYQISDKLHFSKNFYYFYFRFIEPNLNIIKSGNEDEKNVLLARINDGLSAYFCLPFELVCADFLSLKMRINREFISSYWDKDCEIDILAQSDDIIIAGEVKYKEHIVSKKLLKELEAKCGIAGICPDFYVLFSKSGFSGELKALKNSKLLLFSLDDFKDIL